MKQLAVWPLSIVLLVATMHFGEPRCALGASTPGNTLFSDLEHEWMNAVKRQDVTTLDRILAPEFTLTVALKGAPLAVVSRSDYVEACKGYYVIRSFTFDEILVRQYGDVTVVSSRYRQQATLGGTQDQSGEFFLTDTWIRRDGKWQVAARYSSRPEEG